MSEMVKMIFEIPKELAAQYNGAEIEFFKRMAEAKYGKFVKAVARMVDPAKDKEMGLLRPNVEIGRAHV